MEQRVQNHSDRGSANDMHKGFETVLSTLEKVGFECRTLPGQTKVFTKIPGKGFECICRVEVNGTDTLFQSHAQLPLKVPADKVAAAAELCARVSCGLDLGSFVYDVENGEVRFYVYHLYLPGSLESAVVGHLMQVTYLMLERYYPALVAVLSEGVTPANAVAAAKNTER